MENVSFESISEFDSEFVELAIDIQNELSGGLELIQAGVRVADEGIMVSGYTSEEIKKNFSIGAQIFLARVNSKKKPVGFLQSVEGVAWKKKFESAKFDWTKTGKQRDLLSSGNYIYLDQIGVRREFHGTGIAKALLKEFEAIHSGRDCVVVIMTEPLNNTRSTAFFKHAEYEICAEIYFRKFGLVNDFRGILLHKRL